MKKLFVIAALAVATSAFAQASWTLRDTPDGQGTVYRTEVYGTSTRDKNTRRSRVALTLACSPALRPILMIQWEGLQGYGNRTINYSIDGRSTPGGASFVMRQEGDILYRDLESSRELLQSMKSGSTLTVDWVGLDQTRYLTVFNLSTFRSNLSEFNKKCKTEV